VSLPHVLLGLLAGQPQTGYDLARVIHQEVEPVWKAEISQIYPALARLRREGLVVLRVLGPGRGPHRNLYRVTAAGRRELQRWLLEPPPPPRARDDGLARIAFLESLPTPERRQVIRARLMRGTLHLVSARDFYAYAVATQDLQRGAWNRLQIGNGVDPKKVAALAIAFARKPRPKEEVLEHVQARIGGALGGPFSWLVWRFVSAHADLVTAPPGGHWEYGGTDAPYVAASHWIARGERPPEEDALETLVWRCLAAFGPATLADIAQFAGQVPPRVRPTLERLAPKLRTFSDQEGRLLYDLPRAVRPGADVPAPVRFLPRYDELLISYKHRDRVIAPAHRRAVYTKNAIVEAVFTVDGFAAGTWGLVRTKGEAILRVAPFARLPPRERAAVEAEGRELLSFLAPDATMMGVRFA